VLALFQARAREFALFPRFETQYRSPQLSLWSEEDVTWLLAWKTQDVLQRKVIRPAPASVIQPTLFLEPEVT
jgi:hypothetical protein